MASTSSGWQQAILYNPRIGSVGLCRVCRHTAFMLEETILVKIVAVRKDVQLTRPYRHLMETPMAEVRSVGMWHALRVLQRVTHVCVTS